MKYLPNLHTSTVILFSILAFVGFYYSAKAEKEKEQQKEQKFKQEIKAIITQACSQPTSKSEPSKSEPLKIEVKKSKVRIYKTPMEAFEDNDFSKTIDKALNTKK